MSRETDQRSARQSTHRVFAHNFANNNNQLLNKQQITTRVFTPTGLSDYPLQRREEPPPSEEAFFVHRSAVAPMTT